MSVAYYIVLDNDAPGFETFVNGKFLAQDTQKLDTICAQLGIKKFDDFLTMSAEDIADFVGEDVELPEGEGEPWFSAEEGLAFIAALTIHLSANPQAVNNAEGVLEDLAAYTAVLAQAKDVGAKWHLHMDI